MYTFNPDVPGSFAAALKQAMAENKIIEIDSITPPEKMVPPKVGGINPILAMQQHKAKKPVPLPKEAALIIEAGYHCGWSWTEIGDRLSEAGYHYSDETIQDHYDAYVVSIKE